MIELKFNRASNTYESVAAVQKEAANFLITKFLQVQSKTPNNILDLGAGTGCVVEILLKYFPNSSYLINDISNKMLDICKLKFMHYTNCKFYKEDMEVLKVEKYDLIISNFSLQWVKNLSAVLKKFQGSAEVFAFSTLLYGTFQEWQERVYLHENTQVIKDYPTREELLNYCNSIKGDSEFYYWVKDFSITFDNVGLFIKYLKELGAATSSNKISMSALKSLLAGGELKVTYKIFFGIFKKVK